MEIITNCYYKNVKWLISTKLVPLRLVETHKTAELSDIPYSCDPQ